MYIRILMDKSALLLRANVKNKPSSAGCRSPAASGKKGGKTRARKPSHGITFREKRLFLAADKRENGTDR